MNGIMNENQLTLLYEFDEPVIQKIDSLTDSSITDCHNKYFHTSDYICEYDLNFTKITNKEKVNFLISERSMASYVLNKKLTVARENGFIFNQINKFKMKIRSNVSHKKHTLLSKTPNTNNASSIF